MTTETLTSRTSSPHIGMNREQASIYNMIRHKQSGCHIISGSAGTGKTFLLTTLIQSFLTQGKKVQILAPTAAALAVLENRIDHHPSINYRTVASCTQITNDALNLGTSAPTFPLTIHGLADFARFMDMLEVDHTGLVTVWDTTADTKQPVDCTNAPGVTDTQSGHVTVDTDELARRLSTVFAGVSPFAPEVTTAATMTTAGECASRIEMIWPEFPDVVIVDEFSMVNAAQADILTQATASRGALFIGCGDACQLQPVTGQDNPYLGSGSAPEGVQRHALVKQMRSDDAISKIATQVRQGTRFNDLAIAGDISMVDSTSPETLVDTVPEVLSNADVVLTYRNDSVRRFNRSLRKLWKLSSGVHAGERLVCNANVVCGRDYAFRNGELFTISDVDSSVCSTDVEVIRQKALEKPDGLLDMFVSLVSNGVITGVDLVDRLGVVRHAFIWRDPTGVDYSLLTSLSRALLPLIADGRIRSCLVDVSFAYALTVHKAQGAEWDNVVYVVSQRDLDSQGTFHAPYTAVTRAKQSLSVLYQR